MHGHVHCSAPKSSSLSGVNSNSMIQYLVYLTDVANLQTKGTGGDAEPVSMHGLIATHLLEESLVNASSQEAKTMVRMAAQLRPSAHDSSVAQLADLTGELRLEVRSCVFHIDEEKMCIIFLCVCMYMCVFVF